MRYLTLAFLMVAAVAFLSAAGTADYQEPFSKAQFNLVAADSTETWPASFGNHTTDWIATRATSFGSFSYLEFPAASGLNYMYASALWVGGVVGDDTLTSVTQCWYNVYNERFEYYLMHQSQDFCAPDAEIATQSNLYPLPAADYTGFRSTLVDTFSPTFALETHTPLGLHVVCKSYSIDERPFDKCVLVDYTVTNSSEETIHDAFVGMYVDGDVWGLNLDSYEGTLDDMVGSCRDLGFGYVIDNDGDPVQGAFTDSISTLDGLGLRMIRVYPHTSDTNFNWWHTETWADFGPRLKGTPENPYRDFRGTGDGTPSDDIERYYLLSHHEWDFDQCLTATIDSSDPLWRLPDDTLAVNVARGGNVVMLLSVGPVDLEPDSSMRFVYALFGGEFVHVDPSNGSNLLSRNWYTYRDNLHLDLLRHNSIDAATAVAAFITPEYPPSGFGHTRMAGDTAEFRWDPWVFPDIDGYRIELRPLDMGSGSVGETSTRTFPPMQNHCIITDLIPGQLYAATISHLTGSGTERSSPPVLIGDQNELLQKRVVPRCREFTFFTEGDTTVRVNWKPIDGLDVMYYKIYKAADSAEAAGRFTPFISNAPQSLEPNVCFASDTIEYCLYQMPVYDSTDSDVCKYYDIDPVAGSFYWVSAVPMSYVETDFSDLIACQQTAAATRDIAVIMGSTPSQLDYVEEDSIVTFYDSVLAGMDYELYYWTDSNLAAANCTTGFCTDWRDLVDFRLVIVEEYAVPHILTKDTEPVHKLLTKIVDAERNLAYFGSPPGGQRVTLNDPTHTIAYDSGSFESDYLNLDSMIIYSWMADYGVHGTSDSLAGFCGATPIMEELPEIPFDTTRDCLKTLIGKLFETGRCLPLTPAFLPTDDAEVLYTYQSHYPETSELQGLPCGVYSRHDGSHTYAFSFHLWAMDPESARELVSFLITGPPELEEPLLPDSPQLQQNYPNPFNASTLISFYLPKNSRVSLTVYNILGQRVKTLLDGVQMTGPQTHRVDWNGTDGSGQSVATGVYFYRLEIGDQSAAKKMMLLK